jgi:hypothetical protein
MAAATNHHTKIFLARILRELGRATLHRVDDVNFISKDEIPKNLFILTRKYDKPGTQLVTFGDDNADGNMTTVLGGPSPRACGPNCSQNLVSSGTQNAGGDN